MIRLSRSGWNNIIIFAVMGFILLINLTQKNTDGEATESPVFAEQALFDTSELILTIEVNQRVLIERIGRTWRASPAVIEGQALEQMMLSWQSLSGKKVSPPALLDRQMGLLVDIAIAGQVEMTQLQVYDYNDTLYVYKVSQDAWYQLPLALFSQLFPSQVL